MAMEIARFSNLIRTLPGNRRAAFGRRGTRGLDGEANIVGKRVRLPSPCLFIWRTLCKKSRVLRLAS